MTFFDYMSANYEWLADEVLRWGEALLILWTGWWAGGRLGGLAYRALARIGVDRILLQPAANAVSWAVRVFAIVGALGKIGVQTASIMAVLGAAGLAIGLALQGTLQNIAAGVMLIVLRPFQVGDLV